MPLSLVAAIAQNNCIGKNGTLPWHIPEDLKHFKEITTGKIVLMGRKTWDSLPAKFRPLPNRINLVITTQANLALPEGVEVFMSIAQALGKYGDREVAIIGGAQIFNATIDLADTLYITHVQQTVEGDVFFPPIDPKKWHEIQREDHDEFSFVTYKKIG